ncbi:MAG: hypothetical protein AAF734_06020, partial [Bacteroidota bacterium]
MLGKSMEDKKNTATKKKEHPVNAKDLGEQDLAIYNLLKRGNKESVSLACELAEASGSIEGFRPYELIVNPEDGDSLIERVRTLLEVDREVVMIDLSGQALETLPEAIFQFPEIRHLKLSQNKLKDLPSDLRIFEDLQYLYLSDNAFDCFPNALLAL